MSKRANVNINFSYKDNNYVKNELNAIISLEKYLIKIKGADMEFSERLKELRADRDMSQIELAKALNLRSSAISKYENNLTQPSIDTLKKLASIFDVTVDYLVGVSDIENPYEKDKITPYEAEFVAKLRRLNYENRIRIDERMKAMIEVQPM